MPVLEDQEAPRPDVAVVHMCINCGWHGNSRPERGKCPTCRGFKIRAVSYDPECQHSLVQDLIDDNERAAYLRLMKRFGFA